MTGDTERWGLSHIQWGVIANGSLILLILSMSESGTATLALELGLSAIGGLGIWMFFGTVPESWLAEGGQEADRDA